MRSLRVENVRTRVHIPGVLSSTFARVSAWRLRLLGALVVLLPSAALGAPDSIEHALSTGPLYAAAAALLGGLLVSLTPCVYPMIAITVSVFGAKQARSRAEGLLLSLAFVAGIVAMFTPLGVVAGLTGSLFGAVLQNPWVLGGIAVLFLAMSASLFGAFDVALPPALTNRLATIGGIGRKGAFGLGLVCGLIAAPCTGPVLTGILTYIAQSQSAVAGALLMLAFSLGLGAPFFAVGALSVQLPKSGRFMVHVKSLLAIVLAIVALYYLSVAFPGMTSFVLASTAFRVGAIGAIVLGLALGAVHLDFASPLYEHRIRKGLGAALVTVSGFALVTSLGLAEGHLDFREMKLEEARASARASGKPLLVDFTASWCGACKELEAKTFSEPGVRGAAARFLALRIDATNDEDPAVQAVMKELRVVGLPTVLLIDSTGQERFRFNDFVDAREFRDALLQVN